jgi:hypothetical protein
MGQFGPHAQTTRCHIGGDNEKRTNIKKMNKQTMDVIENKGTEPNNYGKSGNVIENKYS